MTYAPYSYLSSLSDNISVRLLLMFTPYFVLRNLNIIFSNLLLLVLQT